MNDPIVDEVRRINDELAARFNYDLKAIYEHLKQREKEREEETERKSVSPPPRRVEPRAAPMAPAPPLASDQRYWKEAPHRSISTNAIRSVCIRLKKEKMS